MISRWKTHYSGDLGEVRAVEQFLHMGASVNSLTASDYGWDLHIHVPEEEMYFTKTDLPPRSWSLSGRTAHVQVKRRSSKGWPSLSVETVRGWLTGTSAGTPTFVFIVDDSDPVVSKFRFCDPRSLNDWLYHHQALDTAVLGQRWTKSFKSEEFPRLLQLWVRFPNVLLGEESISPFLNTAVVPPKERVYETSLEVVTGYCVHHKVAFRDDPSTEEKNIVEAFTGRYAEYDPEDALWLKEQLHDSLRWRASLGDDAQAIVSGGIPLAAYTQSVNPVTSLTEAVDCSDWMTGLFP